MSSINSLALRRKGYDVEMNTSCDSFRFPTRLSAEAGERREMNIYTQNLTLPRHARAHNAMTMLTPQMIRKEATRGHDHKVAPRLLTPFLSFPVFQPGGGGKVGAPESHYAFAWFRTSTASSTFA